MTHGLLYLAGIAAVAFALTLLFPPRAWRWLVALGAAFAAGEWVLAYQRSAERDDAREGLSLVLVSGLFAVYFLALWLLGVAAAVAARRARTRRAGP